MSIPDVNNSFEIIGRIKVGLPNKPIFPSRKAVLETLNPSNQSVHKLDFEVAKNFFYKKIEGLLVLAPEYPPIDIEPHQIIDWIKKGFAARNIRFNHPNSNIRLENGGINYVVGICFPQETEKGKKGFGWVFVVVGTYRESLEKKNKEAYYLPKVLFIGKDMMTDRVPRLIPLCKKVVAVCGLGALGSFAAIELARCGIKELRILDFDLVDPPTTVRWPLGLTAAGFEKTEILKKFIRENYPATNVEVSNHKLGCTIIEGNSKTVPVYTSDEEIINKIFEGADLMMDLTAEEGINNYLSRKAIRRKLSHVIAYATPGAWGGIVMRWKYGQTEGCWNCLKLWQCDDESLVPPVDDQGMVQPPGCGDLTFTGASFDLQQISSASVRICPDGSKYAFFF